MSASTPTPANTAPFALELRDVRKSFGKTEIIRGALKELAAELTAT